MTATTLRPTRDSAGSSARADGGLHHIQLRGNSYRLRLDRVGAGWLASVDTVDGPSYGFDHSPYLAVSRAIEPVGGQLMDALLVVPEFAAVRRERAAPQS